MTEPSPRQFIRTASVRGEWVGPPEPPEVRRKNRRDRDEKIALMQMAAEEGLDLWRLDALDDDDAIDVALGEDPIAGNNSFLDRFLDLCRRRET